MAWQQSLQAFSGFVLWLTQPSQPSAYCFCRQIQIGGLGQQAVIIAGGINLALLSHRSAHRPWQPTILVLSLFISGPEYPFNCWQISLSDVSMDFLSCGLAYNGIIYPPPESWFGIQHCRKNDLCDFVLTFLFVSRKTLINCDLTSIFLIFINNKESKPKRAK